MQVTVRSFTNDLATSMSYMDDDKRLLSQWFGVPVADIHKTTAAEDMAGVDFAVITESGNLVGVDVKRRETGACKWWQSPDVPELAVELATDGRAGPLFRKTIPAADYWACVYEDLPGQLYLLPVLALTRATRANIRGWIDTYGVRKSRTWNQDGSYSTTMVVFVPLPAVMAAIGAVMAGTC